MFTMKIGIYENSYTDVPCDMIKRKVEDLKEASSLYCYLKDKHESLRGEKRFGIGFLLKGNKVVAYVNPNGAIKLHESNKEVTAWNF